MLFLFEDMIGYICIGTTTGIIFGKLWILEQLFFPLESNDINGKIGLSTDPVVGMVMSSFLLPLLHCSREKSGEWIRFREWRFRLLLAGLSRGVSFRNKIFRSGLADARYSCSWSKVCLSKELRVRFMTAGVPAMTGSLGAGISPGIGGWSCSRMFTGSRRFSKSLCSCSDTNTWHRKQVAWIVVTFNFH